MKRWSLFLTQALRVADYLRSSELRRVEAGIVGLEGVRWADKFPSRCVEALEPWAIVDMTHPSWSDEKQLEFLTRAYNAVRLAFGLALAMVGQNEVAKIIKTSPA